MKWNIGTGLMQHFVEYPESLIMASVIFIVALGLVMCSRSHNKKTQQLQEEYYTNR